MLDKYKGRIIALLTVIFAVGVWDIIYYGIYKYEYNFILDTSYTLVIIAVLWWLSSFYDQSRILLKHLSKSEDRFKRLSESTFYVFSNLNQPVFQVDKELKITLLNPAWEKLTGFTIQESLGHSLISFIYPEDRKLVNVNTSISIKKKETIIQDEVRFRKKDGGFIWVEINTKIHYCESSAFESAVGTLTDITHWKLSENELMQINENLSIQSEKLKVVAQMSAAIAHEVRNPLTAIFGFIQLLKEQKNLQPQYIDVIFSEIERINVVLSEMLVLSKPQVTSFHKIDLYDTLEHVRALVSSETNMKSIALLLQKSPHPIWVYGEEIQLKQVFINILKNAIEALKPGGKIEINYDETKDFVSIYVKDNGPGIPKEILGMLGQPFYTSKEKGTGLGLTICYKIIENHRGKIHISSELGVGTTFEIILPLYKQEYLVKEPLELTASRT
jgi:two-component system, sporulation sensor kinase C